MYASASRISTVNCSELWPSRSGQCDLGKELQYINCTDSSTICALWSTEPSIPKPLIPDGYCTPAAICNQSKLRHLSPFLLQGSISWAELWQASSLNYSIANCPGAALLLWPYQNFINSLIKQEVEKGRRPLGSAMWALGRGDYSLV